MTKNIFICILYFIINSACAQAPTSTFQQYSLERTSSHDPNINYYLSKPSGAERYPIVILVGGSTDKEHLASMLEFHRYFMKNISENNLGVITVEKWGIDSDEIAQNTVMAHYTRTQILHDYQQVIDDIKKNPPSGWNGKMALLGVSEGGDILVQLNEKNPNIVATVFWSGTDDVSPRESLWLDMQQIYKSHSECHSKDCNDISTRTKYDARMDEILRKPSSDAYFFNMTHLYVADYLNFPLI